MITEIILVIFSQFIFNSIFIFLGPILNYFFKNDIKKLNLNLILYSLIADFIFIKPLGFFLVIISFSLVIICFLEKILSYQYFYQKIIYLLIFNFIFFILFSFLVFGKIFITDLFLRLLMFNFIFQIIYLFFKESIKIK